MNTNKILFLTALGSILLAVIIIPMIIFKPWIPIDPLYVSGKIFYLRITEPLILDQIVFSQTTESGNVKTYSIKPVNPNYKLAKIDVELTNHSESIVKTLIDEKAAELITTKQGRFEPINSVSTSELISNENSNNSIEFSPLWGSVDLLSNEIIKGSLVFEVPPNLDFSQFAWLASDSITISYKE